MIEGPLNYILEQGYIELLFIRIQEDPDALEELFLQNDDEEEEQQIEEDEENTLCGVDQLLAGGGSANFAGN
jgi:hypothetical protein